MVVGAVLAVAPLLAACGAGQLAETTKENFAQGSYADLANLRIRGLQLVAPAGSSTLPGSAALQVTIYNAGQSPAQLTDVSTDSGGHVAPASAASGGSSAPSSSAAGGSSAAPSAAPSAAASAGGGSTSGGSGGLPLTVPPGGGISIGPGTNHQLTVAGLPGNLRVGSLVTLSLSFSGIGSTSLPVPVTSENGTTALSTPMNATPQQYPAEHIDPSWSRPPYDVGGSLKNPSKGCSNPNSC